MGKSSDEIADSITERREQEADLNRRSADEIEAAGNLAAAVDGGLGRAIATESSPANDPQGPAASEREMTICALCVVKTTARTKMAERVGTLATQLLVGC